MTDFPYWVFVCNPRKWAIDRFLENGIERDSWGVRKHDRHRFAPGQLAVVRVGVDRRSAKERRGKPRLEPGIYAICEVESTAFPSTGASDQFWLPGEQPRVGKPTVKIRYLKSFPTSPLPIERLRVERHPVSHLFYKSLSRIFGRSSGPARSIALFQRAFPFLRLCILSGFQRRVR